MYTCLSKQCTNFAQGVVGIGKLNWLKLRLTPSIGRSSGIGAGEGGGGFQFSPGFFYYLL